jgi:hypothetical protein
MDKGNAYRLLVEMPEGKTPPGGPRRRWVGNINMDFGEIREDGVDWIGITKDRDEWRAHMNVLMNLRVP